MPASSHSPFQSSRHRPLRLQCPPASGADLPEDLFDLILDFLQLYSFSVLNDVQASKQQLGCIALVCRRWARFCQAKIFEEVTLRSRQEYLDLRSFVTRPNSAIPRSIRGMLLKPDILSVPWIHNVCLNIVPRMLHPQFTLRLCLVEGQGTPLSLGRSIHGSLPRAPFPTFSSGIQILHLTNIHFRNLENLARLIGELPSLWRLCCFGVTWPPLPIDQPCLASFVTSCSASSVRYVMEGCTDDHAVVILSSQIVSMNRPRLSREDIGKIYRMAHEHGKALQSQLIFDASSGSGGEQTVSMLV